MSTIDYMLEPFWRLIGASVLIVLWLLPPAFALDPDLAITQYVQTIYRAPQSLPHDNISAIHQTRDGYLWVGTVEGLARFDGVSSVVYDKSNTPAIANNWIRDLMEDSEGRLWIATFGGGLVCRKEGRFLSYGSHHGLNADTINALFEDSNGRIWVGTASGLFRFENENFVRETGTKGEPPETVRGIAEDHNGVVWIGTESGLYRYDESGAEVLTRVTEDKILSLAVDRDGLWIGTQNTGVRRLVDGRISEITENDGLTHERIWSLAVDSDGNLWIGTDGGGLNRWSHGRLTSFTAQNGLTNDYVWAIFEDRERNLWVGTNGGGLNCLKNGSVVPITTREGLPSNFIWSVHGSHGGGLWIGTEDAGVARLKNGRVTTYGTGDDLTTNAKVLLEQSDGTLLIGGNTGVNLWKEGRIISSFMPGLESNRISAFLQGTDGTLWIGTGAEGLKHWKGGLLREYTRDDGLTSNNITSLLRVRDGSLWIGTMSGLNRLMNGRFTSWTGTDGLPSEYVSSICEGPDGSIWGGTRGGVFRIRNGQVGSVTSRDGLFDDAVVSILVGDDGCLWMGGNRGLHCTTLQDMEDVMEGRRQKVRWRALGLDDGMRSLEINGSGSSAWKGSDGRLYFPTREGIAILETSRLVRNPVEPSVVIEEMIADGQVVRGQSPWELPAGTRRLEIHFSALSFASPSGVRIKHRLDGFDPDWVDTKQRTAGYTNLPPGSYRFRVIAANGDGVWNSKGAVVNFVMQPYFYQTVWFQISAVLIFAFAGPLFYFVRVRRLRHQKEELERLVAERTAEVQAANNRLAQLAREDSLTGVANRRRFDEALDEEWRRACRMKTSLALLLIDVDFFKDYNDQLGHIAGDECLQKVAAAVATAHTRAGELVARYGGEEFAVLIPATTRDKAEWEAERLRLRIQELALTHPKSTAAGVVTISVGVAWLQPVPNVSTADLIEAADTALYRAKRSGRNRVEVAPPIAEKD